MVEATGAGARPRRDRRWSLRTHLLGLAATVLALSALVGVAVTASAYSSAKDRAVAGTRAAARQVAAALDRDTVQATQLTAASAPGIGPVVDQAAAVTAHPDLCTLTFSPVGVFPDEGAVHILTGDGRVLCSSAREAVGRSYAAAPWFTRLAGGETITAGDERDAITGGPTVVAAAPVQGASGRVTGALVTSLGVGGLAPALAGTFGGAMKRQFVVVGGDGRVLSSSIDRRDEGRAAPRLADGATGPDSRGARRIWGVTTVDRLGWQVRTGTSEALALAPAREERNRLALVLVTALAAAVILALLVNRRLIRPVRDLSATVRQASTDAGARAPVEGPAELADLALGLNQMLTTRQHDEELLAGLAAELEATAVSLVEAREQERQALAVALHDTTLQGLIAASWQLDALADGGGNPAAVARLRHDLETLIEQTRAVTSELRPPALADIGLGAAVDELAHRASGDWNLPVEVEDRLAGARFTVALEMLVYRAIQEALQNVRKHARATKVRIVLEHQEDRLRATVADDGIGVDDAVLAQRAREGHLGVVSMRDTIRLAKGRFSIGRGASGGTVVDVEVPVKADGRPPVPL